mmetsp:Transcript_1495/g.1905  ORF Transcript_1495/g.1905 Transcript_1495/m.1905 type:complete len:98 (+) Transcript_1495:433-726(+)
MELVHAVDCGYYSSFAISQRGELYACGSNSFGQLGTGNTESSFSFIPVTETPEFRSLSCENSFTIFLDANGVVYGTGRNDCGRRVHISCSPAYRRAS